MLRLTVLGLALGAIAVGNSAYTQKAENESFVGEVYVNISTSPDQYEVLSGAYDDTNCQDQSGMICSYKRTEFDPTHQLPESFTEAEAEAFVTAGWLEPNSAKEGLYTP